ncbi:hypothetical protein ACFYOD_09305 [Streptomyces sp. NPDC006703]|uniref:hypothetical protein n=1 Tax=Streptomyces sp. NPDC006703 TaxID=3364759 RepID=UPI0036C88B1A
MTAVCEGCKDLNRTVLMLGDLALYAHEPGADPVFVEVVGAALAASLPEDTSPPGPGDGTDYPGQGW